MPFGNDAIEMARGHASLGDPQSRAAFVHTLRASVDVGGQRVQAVDRLYLAAELPLLIVWGARDRIIPVEHGRRAHELVPGSRFELFERAGHFPLLDEPERFVATLEDWVATTEPAAAMRPASAPRFAEMAHARADEFLAVFAVLSLDGGIAAEDDHVRDRRADRRASDLPALYERVCSLLARSGAALAVCDVDGVDADAVAVDALARLQLAARRHGCRIGSSTRPPSFET